MNKILFLLMVAFASSAFATSDRILLQVLPNVEGVTVSHHGVFFGKGGLKVNLDNDLLLLEEILNSNPEDLQIESIERILDPRTADRAAFALRITEDYPLHSNLILRKLMEYQAYIDTLPDEPKFDVRDARVQYLAEALFSLAENETEWIKISNFRVPKSAFARIAADQILQQNAHFLFSGESVTPNDAFVHFLRSLNSRSAIENFGYEGEFDADDFKEMVQRGLENQEHISKQFTPKISLWRRTPRGLRYVILFGVGYAAGEAAIYAYEKVKEYRNRDEDGESEQ